MSEGPRPRKMSKLLMTQMRDHLDEGRSAPHTEVRHHDWLDRLVEHAGALENNVAEWKERTCEAETLLVQIRDQVIAGIGHS